MNTGNFSKILATLATNARFNADLHSSYTAARHAARIEGRQEPDAPSWDARKQDTIEINGHKILAYVIVNKGRNVRFRVKESWGSVRWYLNGKAVSRANLIKILQISQAAA